MRIGIVLTFLLICGWFGGFLVPCVANGELLEPTRTLEGPSEEIGKLTVVSDPPGLDIVLDGAELGKTPVWQKEVKAGTHSLRIKDKETDIVVEAGQSLGISLHKGEFIIIPKKKETAAVEQKPAVQVPEEAARSSQQQEEKKEKELSNWELFINKSIPFFY